MEGITDESFRLALHKTYPEWDYYATDFLRCPSVGVYPDKKIRSHFGNTAINSQEIKDKTIYQILTSPNALTEITVKQILDHGFKWIDLNLGCPSKTVCKNQGGSSLLAQLDKLIEIIRLMRKIIPNRFTCKIRVGYQDDANFLEILKIIEGEGVDALTIHARTRTQMYKGTANWEYIQYAVDNCRLPIVANGDVWTLEDIDNIYALTNCHSIMMARGAMKTPWLAKLYKQGEEDSLVRRKHEIQKFFINFYEILSESSDDEYGKLKRLKSISRYCFDPFINQKIKTNCLRSKSIEEFIGHINEIELKPLSHSMAEQLKSLKLDPVHQRAY